MTSRKAPAPVVPAQCLWQSLREATRAVTRRYDQELKPSGLRIGQYTLLAHLSAHGEARVSDLGEALFLEETTVLRNLRPLAERGYLLQHKGKDRRERYVAITPKGTAALRKARPLWEQAQATMKKVVSRTYWNVIFDALTEVTVGAADIT